MPKQSHYKMDFACVSCTALPISKNRRKGSHDGSPSGGFILYAKGYRM